MKKRVLASFIFLSCFSVLAAACGGNTKSQTTTHNTTVSQKTPEKAPEKAKTPTQAVAPKVTVAPKVVAPTLPKPAAQTKHVKKVVHITVTPSDKDHKNVVNLIVK